MTTKASLLEEEVRLLWVVAWRIWHGRNSAVFRNAEVSHLGVLSISRSYIHELDDAYRVADSNAPSIPMKWLLPPHSCFKLDCDGAFDISEQIGGTGVVVRNHLGVVIVAASIFFPHALDPPTMEALALKEALDIAVRQGWRKIILESDAEMVIDEIQKERPSPSTYGSVVENIKSIAASFVSCSFSCVRRVSADDRAVLDQIIDSLTSLANPSENHGLNKETNKISLKVGKVHENGIMMGYEAQRKTAVLIIGAGRVCRPAAELLASSGSISSHRYKTCLETDFEEQNDVQVIVASLYLKDAEEIIEGIPNATAVQLDVMDRGSLCTYISQVEIVISLLPPSCHTIVANVCIELKKHLVTASYVNDSMLTLDEKAKSAGITILGEMGLDPGIDHMMAMKMINEAHARGGRIKSFVSYCGGLPSPAAANNPLAYKFSWNPAGAIRAGQNPATYRSHGEIVQVDGDSLYGSAVRVRIPDLPAFALECLPNRNSLVYGELYGIGHEASTIFRGTLRYEGFGKIMGSLARIGLFNGEDHPIFQHEKRTTFRKFLCELLNITSENLEGVLTEEKEIAERITTLGHCKEQETAVNAAKTIKFLGLHEQTEIPASCKSAFDVTCLRMEEKLAYASTEQDMVLLHHEVEVEFPDEGLTENHRATLLEFGITKNGRTTTAMALTVGIPAAIGALLLLENKIKTRGVLRPIEPEVYVPALDVLRGYGIKFMEKID